MGRILESGPAPLKSSEGPADSKPRCPFNAGQRILEEAKQTSKQKKGDWRRSQVTELVASGSAAHSPPLQCGNSEEEAVCKIILKAS